MNSIPNSGQRTNDGRLLESGRYQCPPSKRAKSLTNEPTECGRPHSTAMLSPKKYCAGFRKRTQIPKTRKDAAVATVAMLCILKNNLNERCKRSSSNLSMYDDFMVEFATAAPNGSEGRPRILTGARVSEEPPSESPRV